MSDHQLKLLLTIVVILIHTPYAAEISVQLAKRKILRLGPDLDVLVPELQGMKSYPIGESGEKKKLARIFI